MHICTPCMPSYSMPQSNSNGTCAGARSRLQQASSFLVCMQNPGLCRSSQRCKPVQQGHVNACQQIHLFHWQVGIACGHWWRRFAALLLVGRRALACNGPADKISWLQAASDPCERHDVMSLPAKVALHPLSPVSSQEKAGITTSCF